jgi:putative ABC transport system permease protein
MVTLSAINMKLIRDLWRMRGQVLAVAFVIGSGVATLVMSLSTIEALQATTDTYYQRYRFADVFASATRVPQRVSQKIAEIPGVQSLQTRIVHLATLDIDSFEEPVVGQIISIPEDGQPLLNQLVLRKGRWVLPEREDEIILSEPFAQAHNLDLGDSITAILNGHKRQFSIVGLALSPEFIYSIGPGSLLPDDKRFGVMWVSREILEAAYDLKESFNDVVIKLLHNTPSTPVLTQLDAILEPYGGIKSISREDQISNWFVMNEIAQQKTMAKILPAIFLLVSMFLTNMVLSRLIATERTEIGLLKAFGYSSMEIGLHYAKMVILICFIGIFLGSILGAFFGRLNTQMYADLFRFPLLIFQPGPQAFIISGTISMTVAIIGALGAVKQAVKLPPAEAMTPPSPAVYKNAVASKSRLTYWLDQPTRIAIRQISRWPLRSFLTCLGIAMSTGLIIMNLQWTDSLTHLSRVYFFESQQQDIMVGLDNPERLRAIHDFENISGVLRAEPMSIISVEFKSGSSVHRGAIRGVLPENQLQPIYDDAKRHRIDVPKYGIVLSTRLAEKLNIGIGGSIILNVLEGRRASVSVEVVDTFEAFIGMPAFMDLNTLNRLVKQSPRFQFANLLVDSNQQHSIFDTLKNTPRVGAVMLKQSAMDSFNNTIIEHLMVFISMFIGLAFILAFGVTYNSTRIALSERARELATLRVLGFSKGEISYVLLGEVMFLVLLGLPLGFLVGWLLVLSMATAFDTEMFRVPLVIDTSTYGYAAFLVILSAVVSAAIVRRRVDKLDLIKVLKTRE